MDDAPEMFAHWNMEFIWIYHCHSRVLEDRKTIFCDVVNVHKFPCCSAPKALGSIGTLAMAGTIEPLALPGAEMNQSEVIFQLLHNLVAANVLLSWIHMKSRSSYTHIHPMITHLLLRSNTATPSTKGLSSWPSHLHHSSWVSQPR